MHVLALDTSVGCGSLALLEDTVVRHQSQFAADRRMTQTFSVAIADALRAAGWEPHSVRLVATTNGPGSFTGLRIGVTAARFFAYVTGAKLVALNTLDVIVEQLPRPVRSACAVMDAQRRQLFAATYLRASDGTWQVRESCRVIDRDRLGTLLTPQMVVTGPGLSRLPADMLGDAPRADPALWLPQAATVGRLAWRAHEAGRYTDIWQLQPRYYRPSYAEEKG